MGKNENESFSLISKYGNYGNYTNYYAVSKTDGVQLMFLYDLEDEKSKKEACRLVCQDIGKAALPFFCTTRRINYKVIIFYSKKWLKKIEKENKIKKYICILNTRVYPH